ncbi:uncharacterized protein LOC113203891 [Frankliniella occidentalis]|uniref:Uncharacterized protein LOC113203891 n=1 Tax=Frankliniella occidentalis TaxID=133901 RepID=A0A9C6WYJ8_FRAOC|nr:uncharacterized protein LOC113203891 [Frankliniella occidentalis]
MDLNGSPWPGAAAAAALVNDTLLLAAGPYSSTPPSSTAVWEDNVTAVAVPTVPVRHIGLTLEVVLTVCYAVGIAGNLAALVILVRGGRRAHRNRRHSLMLRCLACNDLVALLGMLLTMQAQLRLPQDLVRSRPFCGLRVLWRLFGLGSGSVALVMALERWLALTRPFLYQKHITYHVVRRAIFSMWSLVLLLVSLPLFGFGLYYDPREQRCARYPHATKPADIAYAYVYFTFGMLLIASILCCNLLVVRRLHQAGHSNWGRVRCRTVGSMGMGTSSGCYEGDPQPQRRRWALVRVLLLMRRGRPGAADEPKDAAAQAEQPPPLTRRYSRSSRTARTRALQHSESVDSATHEETAFAKLMGFLCVLFVLCWLPQMIAIPVTQLWPDWSPGKKFSRLADFSLLLHFTLDPFVYVLQSCTRRHQHKSVTPPAAHRHPAAHAPGAVGHALAGAAAAGAASAWPASPAAAQQSQSYMRKLGSSLRLCGALALCSCRGQGESRGRRRQDGLEPNSRDLSLLHYPSASVITRSHHVPNSVAL